MIIENRHRKVITFITTGQEPIEQSFIDALYEAGNLNPPKTIKLNGKWNTLTKTDAEGNTSIEGFYRLDGSGHGAFVSLTSGCPDIVIRPWTDTSDPEGTVIRGIGARTAARRRKAQMERIDAELPKLWDSFEEAFGDHQYFERYKLYHSFGARQAEDGTLAVRMTDRNGRATAIMFIAADGHKRYMEGTGAKGSFVVIGNGRPEFIVRDFESGMWIQEYSGLTCIVTGSERNLKDVAAQFPEVKIVTDNTTESLATAEICNAEYGNPVIRFSHPDRKFRNIADYAANGEDLCLFLNVPHRKKTFDLMRNAVLRYKPFRWLIYQWIPGQKCVTMIYGPSGQFKTYTVIDMFFKIALGFPDWFGHYINRSKVVYFAGEGFYAVTERAKALLKKYDVPATRLNDNFVFVDRSFSLDDPKVAESVIDTLETDFFGFVPKVIALDTFCYFMNGDENTQEAINRFSDGINILMERYNCSVVLVHHTKKGSDEYRGASGLKGILDIMIRVTANDGEITIKQFKNRACGEENVEELHLETETVSLDDVVDSKTGEPKTNVVLVQNERSTYEIFESDNQQKQPDEDEMSEGESFIYHVCLEKGTIDTEIRSASITWDDMYSYGCEYWKTIKPASVRQKLNAKQKNRLLGRLLANGIITETSPKTYSVTDSKLLNRIVNTRRSEEYTDDDYDDGFGYIGCETITVDPDADESESEYSADSAEEY